MDAHSPRTLAACVLLAVVFYGTDAARAMSSQITYQTTGSVGPQAGNANSPVIFRGVDEGSFLPSTPFVLGEFVVNPSASGTVDMPFWIFYTTKAIDGVVPTINETPVMLQGWIRGTLAHGGWSYLEAFFDQGPQPLDPKYYSPHPALPFRTGDLINTIQVNDERESLTLSTLATGRTTIVARIDVTTVPEPSALALGIVALAGAGLRYLAGALRPKTA